MLKLQSYKYKSAIGKEVKEHQEEICKNCPVCPACDKPLLKSKSGFCPYFVGYSGFPSCRYIENLDGEKIKV